MKLYANHHQRLFGVAAGCALASAVTATSMERNLAWIALVDLLGVTERALRLVCYLPDHSNCFSLDRLDPTCPQCM